MPSLCACLSVSSWISLNACRSRIDTRTLTSQQNHIAANLEFFNRIGRILLSASRKCTLRGGSQTSGQTPANESGGLLATVSGLELMSNSKNKDDVFGRKPTVLRDITVATARENEFPSTFLGRPP